MVIIFTLPALVNAGSLFDCSSRKMPLTSGMGIIYTHNMFMESVCLKQFYVEVDSFILGVKRIARNAVIGKRFLSGQRILTLSSDLTQRHINI